MFEVKYEIEPSDLQPAYQHVNHARALSLLEGAREKLLEAIGHPLAVLIERGYLVVVTRIQVDYKREILAGSCRISCENGRIEGKSLSLTQRLYNHRNKEAVLALVELKAIGGSTKRAVEFPPDFIRSFRALYGEGSNREPI